MPDFEQMLRQQAQRDVAQERTTRAEAQAALDEVAHEVARLATELAVMAFRIAREPGTWADDLPNLWADPPDGWKEGDRRVYWINPWKEGKILDSASQQLSLTVLRLGGKMRIMEAALHAEEAEEEDEDGNAR